MDMQSGFSIKDVDLTNGSVVIVECIYNRTKCPPSDGLFDCAKLEILGNIESIACSRILISWSTYLIYKKYFIEVK
jgi:hypothetical protein